MALIQSKFALSKLPIAYPTYAGEVSVNDFFIDLATTDLVAGNIIELGMLPAYNLITDAILMAKLDNGAGLTLDVGLMTGVFGENDATRTMGAEVFAASNAGQSGAVTYPTLVSAYTILPTERDRAIGVKIVAAPATPVAGRLRLRVRSHTGDQNVQF